MARQIIVTDVTKSPDGSFTVTAAFWLTAPANRVKPQPSFVSAVPLSTAVAWGATAGEVAALQAGTVVEQIADTGQQPNGTLAASIQSTLATKYAQAQTALNAAVAGAKFIGASWDGTTWTAAP